MLGGRFFWFVSGVGVGVWVSLRLRKALGRKAFQRRFTERVKSVAQNVRATISEGKGTVEQNGF